MKKVLVTIALTAICVGAFAQGKIAMQNDASRLVYIGSTLPADAALGGQKAPAGLLPSGVTLLVDLYGGVNAGSMTLQQTTTLSSTILGGFGPRQFTSLDLAGATTYTFQVKVRDAAFATAESSLTYAGFSQIFTMRPSSTIAFNAINNTGGTALSTWAAGIVALPGGGFGAIQVNAVPEPSSMALAGLGAASLLIFRRRK